MLGHHSRGYFYWKKKRFADVSTVICAATLIFFCIWWNWPKFSQTNVEIHIEPALSEATPVKDSAFVYPLQELAPLSSADRNDPEPTYEWQQFQHGSTFPAGLEYRLSLDGSGHRDMRIPETWRIQLNLGAAFRLFRTDITRDMTVETYNINIHIYAGFLVSSFSDSQPSRAAGKAHFVVARRYPNFSGSKPSRALNCCCSS